MAFYAGWSTAFSASLALKSLFEDRGIGTDQLPPVSPDLLPADEALPGDAIRKASWKSASALSCRASSR